MILTGLPASVTAGITHATMATLTGVTWFPTTLAGAFMPSLALTFYVGALISLISAVLCAMRGKRYVHELDSEGGTASIVPAGPATLPENDGDAGMPGKEEGLS
jgi:membrane protein implicated in regulation of membrane protease activity